MCVCVCVCAHVCVLLTSQGGEGVCVSREGGANVVPRVNAGHVMGHITHVSAATTGSQLDRVRGQRDPQHLGVLLIRVSEGVVDVQLVIRLFAETVLYLYK